ncbi:MAG TPA: recombinase family protein [bacterium]|nr:recombinase family protein [bacterium]
MTNHRIIGFCTLNRVGRTDTKQKEALTAYAAEKTLILEIVEGRYSHKKKWKARTELVKLLEGLKPGDTLVTPTLSLLGLDSGDILSFIAELMKKKVDLHIVDLGLVIAASGYSGDMIALFTLMTALTVPAKGKPGRKPGRPAKKKRGRPAKKKRGRPAKKKPGRPPKKKKVGRPPQKKVGRPKTKLKKRGRKPARKKRVSSIQQQFNDKAFTIRKYLKSQFPVQRIAEKLGLPYQPLLALLKKHPKLKGLVKKGR